MAGFEVFELVVIRALLSLNDLFPQYFSDPVVYQVAAKIREHDRILVEAHHGCVDLSTKQLEDLNSICGLELHAEATEARQKLRPDEHEALRLNLESTNDKVILRGGFVSFTRLAGVELNLDGAGELDLNVNDQVFIILHSAANELLLEFIEEFVEILVVVHIQIAVEVRVRPLILTITFILLAKIAHVSLRLGHIFAADSSGEGRYTAIVNGIRIVALD